MLPIGHLNQLVLSHLIVLTHTFALVGAAKVNNPYCWAVPPGTTTPLTINGASQYPGKTRSPHSKTTRFKPFYGIINTLIKGGARGIEYPPLNTPLKGFVLNSRASTLNVLQQIKGKKFFLAARTNILVVVRLCTLSSGALT